MTAIARRMRRVLEDANLEHQAVAVKMRINAVSLSRYINGHQDPRAEYLSRFVRATGCDGHWLLTGQGTPFRH